MKINGSQLKAMRSELGLSQAKLAEITKISQHELSAFELEKKGLTPSQLATISKIISNNEIVSKVINRKKRYTIEAGNSAKKVPLRKPYEKQTKENALFRRELDLLYKNHLDKNKKNSALSLFSGIGGFSLGFSAAGYCVKGFVEIAPELKEIYKENFPSSIEMGGDITKVSDSEISAFHKKIGDVDVVVGGPPCQGFSLSGKRDVNDPRNSLFLHYLRFVKEFNPKVCVLENVRVLLSMKNPDGKFVKNEIEAAFAEAGYSAKPFEVNAKAYGVPQHRERVLFIAVRNDLKKKPQLAPQSYGKDLDLIKSQKIERSFADACSDLKYIESGEESEDSLHFAVSHPDHVINWLWSVPEGRSAHDNEDPKLRPPSGYNTTYKRQVWNEPASTVQTTFGMISGCRNVHPIATRSLSIREAARIQTFPDQYIFKGTLGAMRTGIGNAVPPLLANAIALFLQKHFL